MNRRFLLHALRCALASLTPALADATVMIDLVPVGNPGNANDPATGDIYGGVSYEYSIGKYEITVGQYTEFLNAVAADDTYGLYNTLMGSNLTVAGIDRTGSPGSYSYSVIGSPSKPVTYVSFLDAARFSNWLHNGQPSGPQGTGTTEDGAYFMNGATNDSIPDNSDDIVRKPGARWVVPSLDEWHKAAYHKNDGVTGNYWDYPTSTDNTPVSDQPPGAAPNLFNSANFYKNDGTANGYDDGFAVTGSTSFDSGQNYLTQVGFYTSSASPYGTFDQGGNVWEWTESVYVPTTFERHVRGGAWSYSPLPDPAILLKSSSVAITNSVNEDRNVGFRVSLIPEPSSLILAALGFLGVSVLRRQRRFADAS